MQTTEEAPVSTGARPRDPWLDNIRLLAIVLVVVGHAIGSSKGVNPAANALSTFLYLFHIPMFALAAGWTAQRLTASFESLTRTAWQVLLPYVVFQTIALGIGTWDGSNPPWQYATPSFALWFLVALFWWRLLAPWFRGNAWGIAAAVLVTVVAGFMPEVGEPLSLSRALFFFPAFLVGATYADRLGALLAPRAVRAAGAALLAAAFVYCVLFADTMNRQLQLGRSDYGALGMGNVEGVLTRLLTLAVGIGLALACIAVVPRRRTWLTHLGAYTLYAYLLHVVVRRVLVAYDLFPKVAEPLPLLALVAGSALLALVLMTLPVRLLTRWVVEPIWLRNLLRRVGERRSASA